MLGGESLILKGMLPNSNFDLWQLHYFTYPNPIFTAVFSILICDHYQILIQVAAVYTVYTVFVNLFH